jgi:hypothetical protein
MSLLNTVQLTQQLGKPTAYYDFTPLHRRINNCVHYLCLDFRLIRFRLYVFRLVVPPETILHSRLQSVLV